MGSQAGKMLWSDRCGAVRRRPWVAWLLFMGPAQGWKAGVQILSGWGLGSGALQESAGVQGLSPGWSGSPQAHVKRHYSRPDVDKAPLSQPRPWGQATRRPSLCVEGGAAVCTIYRVFIIK